MTTIYPNRMQSERASERAVGLGWTFLRARRRSFPSFSFSRTPSRTLSHTHHDVRVAALFLCGSHCRRAVLRPLCVGNGGVCPGRKAPWAACSPAWLPRADLGAMERGKEACSRPCPCPPASPSASADTTRDPKIRGHSAFRLRPPARLPASQLADVGGKFPRDDTPLLLCWGPVEKHAGRKCARRYNSKPTPGGTRSVS